MSAVSPTMEKLLGLLNEARRKRSDLEQEFRDQSDAEAALEHAYKQAHAKAMLVSEQRTEGLRQAEAEIETGELSLKRRLAVALRRSAKVALDGCHDDAETLQAAFHAYNREIKAELELAGRMT